MADTYRIGVISDTHGTPLPKSVHGIFAGCDYILHAGDIGTSSARYGQAILDELEEIAPVTAVLGNSSSDREGAYYTSTGIVENTVNGLELGGVLFFMTHNNEELLAWKQRSQASQRNQGSQGSLKNHGSQRGPESQSAQESQEGQGNQESLENTKLIMRPQVWIHGHTHRRKCLREGTTYLLCPGSVYYPRDGNGPGVAIITITKGEVETIHFCDL